MKRYLWSFSLLALPVLGQAQAAAEADSSGKIHADLGIMAVATSNNQVPFWMRTNQFGSIPEYGVSASWIGALNREYRTDEDKPRLLDWGMGIEGRLNTGRKVNFRFIEAYVKARLSVVQLKAGRSRDITGIADPDLSSGNFSISGNALGIPKVELSVPDYQSIPFTANIVAAKGSIAYGMFDKELVNPKMSDLKSIQAFFHQKTLYIRLGKPEWKVKLYGGLNHQVMWSDERKLYKQGYNLSIPETIWYVTTGKAYGNDSIPRSKVGNHMGSVDQALAYRFPKMEVMLYHQFYYEVGGLYHLNNIKDGLWGISFTNRQDGRQKIGWRKVVVEFLYSKSQGGEQGARVTPSGDEDYYNNYLYVKGWIYQEENLGNNFMTNKKYLRTELPQQPHEYIGNNRIVLLHAGAQVNYTTWDITARLSYSMNYGTYATSPTGISTGRERQVFDPPYFYKVNQCSGYLEASRPLRKGYRIGIVLAGDYGDLLYRSVGGRVSLSKTW
jgi:hypothetical protein